MDSTRSRPGPGPARALIEQRLDLLESVRFPEDPPPRSILGAGSASTNHRIGKDVDNVRGGDLRYQGTWVQAGVRRTVASLRSPEPLKGEGEERDTEG